MSFKDITRLVNELTEFIDEAEIYDLLKDYPPSQSESVLRGSLGMFKDTIHQNPQITYWCGLLDSDEGMYESLLEYDIEEDSWYATIMGNSDD